MPEVTANIVASIIPLFVLFTIIKIATNLKVTQLVTPFVFICILLMIMLHFGINKELVIKLEDDYRSLSLNRKLFIGFSVFVSEILTFYFFIFF